MTASTATQSTILSIVESPTHPDFTPLYKEMGFDHQWVTSCRKAIASMKKQPPGVLVAEFIYGYGNNYAGANISNLDVTLHSLQKYAKQTKAIVLVSKSEAPYINKLETLFDLHSVQIQPYTIEDMRAALETVSA